MPAVYANPMSGINAGIEGNDMPYAAWFLLNEALWSSAHRAHFATIACLTASVEVCLRRLTGLGGKTDLIEVIDTAVPKGIISSIEAKDLHELRRLRNSYIHFNVEKLPKVESVRLVARISNAGEMKIVEGKEAEASHSIPYGDFTPLFANAHLTAVHLEKTLAIYRRMFPLKSAKQPPYFQFTGIDLDRIVKALLNAALKNTRTVPFGLLRRLFKRQGRP
jgi:hypothetical protein